MCCHCGYLHVALLLALVWNKLKLLQLNLKLALLEVPIASLPWEVLSLNQQYICKIKSRLISYLMKNLNYLHVYFKKKSNTFILSIEIVWSTKFFNFNPNMRVQQTNRMFLFATAKNEIQARRIQNVYFDIPCFVCWCKFQSVQILWIKAISIIAVAHFFPFLEFNKEIVKVKLKCKYQMSWSTYPKPDPTGMAK